MSDSLFNPTVLLRKKTPVLPQSRVVSTVIVVALVTAIVWSCSSRIDIVVSAPGKIIPSGRAKVITSPRLGTVYAIKVRNGDRVSAGDELLLLDTDNLHTELEKTGSKITVHRQRISRYGALAGLGNDLLTVQHLSMEDADGVQDKLLIAELTDFSRAQHQLASRIETLVAKRSVVRARIRQVSAYLPLLKEKVASQDTLVELGYQTRLIGLEDRKEYIHTAQEVGVLERRLVEIDSEIVALKAERARQESTFIQQALENLEREQSALNEVQFNRESIEKRIAQSRIVAPVEGVVEELAVHASRRTVQEAERLMKIIPVERNINVEAYIPADEIGFARPGQPVRVKVDAFPFTRYGTFAGTLTRLSEDAVQIDDGWGFVATIDIDQPFLRTVDAEIALSKGMTVTADIVTGSRSVISYLIDPVKEHTNQGLIER